MKADLILLHAPSIFDFREKPRFWGPINDLVPSTPVFEMYPMGFVSIASTLEEAGYKVKIVNIALRMLADEKFNPEEYIKKMDAELFGIDLHWMPHVHGALNLARLVKKHHSSPVVFGGLSSSYFHIDLLKNFPEVDFVLRGDSTEKPFLQLMDRLATGRFEKVDNLSYREDGRIKVNPLRYVPETLDDYRLDYEYSLKAFLHSDHKLNTLPFKEFLERPIMAVLTRKGCESNCIACGGSALAYKNICGREKIAFRSPEKVVEDLLKIEEFKVPAFILGDLAVYREKYGLKILKGIKREKIDIPMVFEFFYPPSQNFLRELGRSASDFTIEMSPEAGDEDVRMKIGRLYTNSALQKMISQAFDAGAKQFDLYFMVGLGFQDRESIQQNHLLAQRLIRENPRKRLLPFVSPYAPFLDPGSIAFESPAQYEYSSYARTVKDHYNLLDRGITWKDFLSYSTKRLTKDEIVELSYDSALEFARIKSDAGLIEEDTFEKIKHRIEVSKRIIEYVDEKRRKKQEIDPEVLKVSQQELRERLIIKREELDWSNRHRIRRYFALAVKFIKSFF